MAASAGLAFSGTTLGSSTTEAGTYTAAFEIVSAGGVGEAAPPIDMTHTTSPSARREFIPGLSEGKDCALQVNYTRADGGSIETLYNTARWWKVTLSNGDTYVFPGILNDFEVTGEVADKVSASISIKITGIVNHTAGGGGGG